MGASQEAAARVWSTLYFLDVLDVRGKALPVRHAGATALRLERVHTSTRTERERK